MMRASRGKVKPGCSLRERHDQAIITLRAYLKNGKPLKSTPVFRDHYWVCIYHWNLVRGVVIGTEPPNASWPASNRKTPSKGK